MNVVVPDQQIVAGIASTIEWTYLDELGAAATPGAAPTIGITRADGTELIAPATATVEDTDNEGRYTYTLSSVDSAELDMLTVSWTISGTVVATTLVEIVGRFLFTVKEARDSHDDLANEGDYPDSEIVKYRMITESELNWICDRSFVPRFRRITVDGTGDRILQVPDNDLRAVYAVTVGGTVYTDDEIAALKVYQHRRIEQALGSVWDPDQENVVIAYAFGLDRPYPDLKEASLERFRELLWSKGRGLDPHATSASSEGTSVDLSSPSDFATGNNLVDSVYRRRSLRVAAGSDKDGAQRRPYGRTVTYAPQAGSLFHRQR